MSWIESVVPYGVSMVVALVVCAGLMPLVIRVGCRLGAVDTPGGRRVHSGEIPRLGGIAIYFGFVAGVGAATLLAGRAANLSDRADYHWLGVALGMTVMFLAGMTDDLFHLRPGTKLLLQVLAAAIAINSGFTIDLLTSPLGGSWAVGALGPLLTLAWILLVVNAINLIDGLDGLAGGLALIITSTVALVAFAMNRFGVVITAFALMGALVGFLRFNYGKAKIFMGDGGSQFLGYALAIISVRGSQKGATAVAIFVPMLVLGLPIVDLATTIVRRLRRAARSGGPFRLVPTVRSVARADKEHLHHNLVDLGVSPRRAVHVLYALGITFALSGYLCLVRNGWPLAVLTLCLSFAAIAWIKVLVAGDRPSNAAGSEARSRPGA